jgi:hypothetical protein
LLLNYRLVRERKWDRVGIAVLNLQFGKIYRACIQPRAGACLKTADLESMVGQILTQTLHCKVAGATSGIILIANMD